MKRILILFLLITGFAGGQNLAELDKLRQIQIGGGFDSGLILNGTFENSTNTTLGSEWSISGGVAICTTVSGFSQLKMATSTTLTASANYTITFTVANSGTARFNIRVTQSGGDAIVQSNATYANGTHVVSLTMPAGADSTDIIFENSSAATNFDIDNVSLTAD